MTSIGTGYDLSASTYSPDGRIFQVEYAAKAVENSGTCIGLRAVDGIVLAVERPAVSKLFVSEENKRILSADDHIGLVSAGILADFFHIAARACKETRAYKRLYGRNMSGKVLSDRLAGYVQLYTLYSSVRPFGTNIIVGTVDSTGPSIYEIEPSGQCYGYYGIASGKSKQAAKTEIEKLDFSTLSCRQAVKEAVKIMFSIHDEARDKEFELEVSWICEESGGKHQSVPQELISEAENIVKVRYS